MSITSLSTLDLASLIGVIRISSKELRTSHQNSSASAAGKSYVPPNVIDGKHLQVYGGLKWSIWLAHCTCDRKDGFLLYSWTGPRWKGAFWLAPWAVRIFLYGPLRWTPCIKTYVWKKQSVSQNKTKQNVLQYKLSLWSRNCSNRHVRVFRALEHKQVSGGPESNKRKVYVKNLIELACPVRIGKIWISSFFFFFVLKQNSTNIFPIRTE